MPSDQFGIRLQSLLLADYANVREGMLNVVSAGITRVGIETFPGHMPAHVAMQFYIPPDAFDQLHRGAMTVKYYDGVQVGRAEFVIHMPALPAENVHPGEAIYFPASIPILQLAFERPGQVDINISVNENHCGSLTFWIVAPSAETADNDAK